MRYCFAAAAALTLALTLASCESIPNIAAVSDAPVHTTAEYSERSAPASETAGTELEFDVTDVISDRSDLDSLSVADRRRKMIEAFLTGDLEALASGSGASVEAYKSYRGMEFGEYAIRRELLPTSDGEEREFLVLNVDILKSDNDVLVPGRHKLVAVDDFSAELTPIENFTYFTSWEGFIGSMSEAQRFIYDIRSTSFDYFVGTGQPDAEQKVSADYIVCRLARLRPDAESFTSGEIKAYAKKYFDIDDYTIRRGTLRELPDGGYGVIGRGVSSPTYSFVSEEERDGHTVVTVQFWADYSKTVKSKLVEFHIIPLDGDFKPLLSVTLEDSGLETAYTST